MEDQPIRCFKFMKKKYVQDFLKGKVRIGTMTEFREMDEAEWIADPREGTGTNTMGPQDFSTMSEADRLAMIRRINATNAAYISENTKGFKIEGMHLEYKPVEGHIFCVSIPPFDTARRAMCVDAPPEYRYDACVEILDLRRYMQCLLETGIIGIFRFTEVFEDVALYCPVKYRSRVANLDYENPVTNVAFLKDKKFETQQEGRILFRYNSNHASEPGPFFAYFRVPSGLLREVSVS